MSDRPAFWKPLDHYEGAKHLADPTHPGYVPLLLVVFVHGILSTHETTWQDPRRGVDLPRQLLDVLGIEADVLNFRYPSGWPHRVTLERAADRLAGCLDRTFPANRYVLFVTHSNGGIVVKRYLRGQYRLSVDQLDRVLTPPGGEFYPAAALDTAWGRTVGVLNFDVPHRGGASWMTVTGSARTLATALPLGAGQLLRDGLRKRLGEYDAPEWGWNRLLWFLCPFNPRIGRLHREHLADLAGQEERAYPRPAVRDVLAEQDGVIVLPRFPPLPRARTDGTGRHLRLDDDDREYQTLPGHHSSVKSPSGYDQGAVYDLLAGPEAPNGRRRAGGWLDGLRDWRSLRAADLLLRRLLCDRLIRADRPIGPPPVPGGVVPPATTQSGLLRETESRIEYGETRIQVVGPPGVGKSMVLRLLARRYAVDYRADWWDTSRRLPLFVQLRDPAFAALPSPGPAAPRTRAGRLLIRVAGAWADQANALHGHGRRFTGWWLLRRLRNPGRRTLLVVDSIDEFLAGHRDLTLANVREAFGRLDRLLAGRAGVAVVAATRLSLYPGDPSAPSVAGITGLDLVGAGRAPAALWEMREEDCRASFPRVGALLARVPADVRRMLLTPLFARIFDDATDPNGLPRRLTDPVETFRIALESLYRHSGLFEPETGGPNPPGADAWTSALAGVVQWMFEHFRTSVPAPPAAFWDEATRDDFPRRLADGAAILRDPRLRELLLRRTVLRAVVAADGADEFALYHKEFEDFLLAWFYAASLEAGRVEVFARRALNTQIYTAAGVLLVARGFLITRTLVGRLVAEARLRNHWFVFGNVGALIGNSFLPVVGPAVEDLLDALLPPAAGAAGGGGIDPTVRVIMLANWARRALRATDPGAAARDPFARVLLDELTRPGPGGLEWFARGPVDEPLTRSVAACYLWEFAARSGADPRPPAAPLDTTPAAVERVAELLDPGRGDRRLTAEQFRSLEQGWCRVVLSVFRDGDRVVDGDRAVMAVHYLFALTAAVRLGRFQDAATPPVVREALAPGSALEELAAARAAAHPDDPVARAYAACREVNR